MSLKKAIQLIKRNKSFLITSHVNSEADALGSELAFMYLLKRLGKEAFIINESKVPVECEFLPYISKIQPLSSKIKKFDCLVFMDCSDDSRAGKVASIVAKAHSTLNIDHHISNSYFANVNWVASSASCTCEMVYRLYRKLKVAIDKNIAILLYAAIVVDTGSFRFNNTNYTTHQIAARLIKTGIPVARVYNSLCGNNPFNDIKLLGFILSTIERNSTGRIVWAAISAEVLGDKYPSIDLSEAVLNLLRSIKGVELAVVFKEIKGKKKRLRINFRSQSNFDCNLLAAQFGGGGHKNASGATISGDFTKIKREVIKQAEKLMLKFIKCKV